MSARMLCATPLLGAMLLLMGCGNGGGAAGGNSKSTARTRVVASTRIQQATFAIVGLGRPITRAARPRLGLIALIPRVLHPTRDVVQGQDSSTKLYYTRTVNADGSGQIDLFTDAARTHAAGGLTWGQPQWKAGVLNGYPAAITVGFQITTGQLKGDKGTLDLALQDASGNNETLHLAYTDAQNEKVTADFQVVNGVLSGKTAATLSDGANCTCSDAIGLDGVLEAVFAFSDGSQETLTTEPDGTGTETYDDPNGTPEATGAFDDTTGDTAIDYSDGSTETVNVDDNSDNSSNNNNGGS